jgi:hypothetical protein
MIASSPVSGSYRGKPLGADVEQSEATVHRRAIHTTGYAEMASGHQLEIAYHQAPASPS